MVAWKPWTYSNLRPSRFAAGKKKLFWYTWVGECISNVLPDRVMGTNLLSGIPFQCSSLPKGTFSLWTRCWACTNWWQAASSSSLQSSSLSRMVMLGGTSARFWVSLIFLVLHSRIRALLMACLACVYSTSIIISRIWPKIHTLFTNRVVTQVRSSKLMMRWKDQM